MVKGFGFRELRAPRNDAFGLAGIMRFDQGSTESLPTGKLSTEATIPTDRNIRVGCRHSWLHFRARRIRS